MIGFSPSRILAGSILNEKFVFPNFQRFFDCLSQAHLRFSHQLCVHLRMAWLGDFEGQKPAEM
jgi:hypothetical protein